jgi:hypothetical protein
VPSVGFFLAFVPIVGNLLAFLAATELRDWPTWLACCHFLRRACGDTTFRLDALAPAGTTQGLT